LRFPGVEIQWPETWAPIPRELGVRLEEELGRELSPSHQLYGQVLKAIAKRGTRDDVLFQGDAADGPVYLVHLTWARETNPTWPSTERYSDISDFLERWPRDEFDEEDAI
jgi:hypothetical protein